MKLREYQVRAIDSLRQSLFRGNKRIVCYAPTGCHAAGERILLANGSIITAESVMVGERLLGDDGQVRIVSALHRGRQRMVRITPVKGQPFTVNIDHILSLVHTTTGAVLDVSVRQWLAWPSSRKHLYKLYRVPVVMFEGGVADLPVHPWLMGVLLGDGSFSGSPVITNPDPAIQELICSLVQGVMPQIRKYGSRCDEVHLRNERGVGNPLLEILRELGLDGKGARSKFIPPVYKTASFDARRQLLAGLLDTDGHFSRGSYDWISASDQLADDVVFVARSLGLAAYKSSCEKYCQTGGGGTYYRVSLSGDFSTLPTIKHQPPPRRQVKNVLRTGFTAEVLPEAEYFGWTVDGNGRYLLADFTVTHNSGKTEIAIAMIRSAISKGKRVAFVCNRVELVKQASDRFWQSGLDHGIVQGQNTLGTWKEILICSIQTLARRGFPDMDLIVVDEAHGCAGSQAYRSMLKHYARITVIGLSATPFSKGLGKHYDGLGNLFEDLVVATTIADLVSQGYLVDVQIYSPSDPDLSGVKIVAGDYHEGQLGEAMDKPPLIGDIVTHWRQLGQNKPTVCFATNIAHSKHIVEQFTKAGITAEHIDCYTSEEDRKEILNRVSSGQTTIISNVGILSEGWDCLDIETEILTPNGWKGRGQIAIGDDVFSLNRDTGKMEITPIKDYIERSVKDGELMVEFSSQHMNIRVTGGHEFHIKYRESGQLSRSFITKSALELSNRKSAFALPLAAEYEFDGVDLSDDELRFVAWFMTDGGFNKSTEIAINQSQAKAHYVYEIRSLLTRLRFDFRERVRETNRSGHFKSEYSYHEFAIPKGNGTKKRAGWERLEPYLNKKVSPLLHAMDRRQFGIFWSEMLKGDGEKQGSKTGWLWCCEKEQADAWTQMAVTRGFSASFSKRITPNGVVMYRVSVRDKRWITTAPGDKRATRIKTVAAKYDEVVWCVRNRNSTLVTRRGGKIAIIGNCPPCEVMILARPTKSIIRYIQMAGRILRPYPGKTIATILDHSGSARELGYPTDDLPLMLDDGKPKKSGRATKEKPKPKKCPKCAYLKPAGVHLCPACGFAPERQSDVRVVDGKLSKLERKRSAMTSESKRVLFAELKGIQQERKWSDGRTAHVFRDITGVWPNSYRHVPPSPPSQETLAAVKHLNIRFAKRKQKESHGRGNTTLSA